MDMDSIHWQVLFIQILCLHLHTTVQETDQDLNKDAEVENITIFKGTPRYNLLCNEGTSKPTWEKNGQSLSFPENKKFNLENLQPHEYPLLCVEKINEGIYTCNVQNATHRRILKKIVVQVSESSVVDKCGNKKRALIQEGVFCERQDYPCCEAIPVAPREMNIKISSSLGNSVDECDIYTKLDTSKNPWDVSVSWEPSSVGGFGTWGWQINAYGLDGDPGSSYCVQINSKDQILKWTIPAKYLAIGAKYNITLQTLPDSGELNSIFEIAELPSWQVMCKTIGRNCTWEICLPVENLTVTNYSSSPLVSWRPSPFYKTKHVFEVIYRDENNSDMDKIIVENGNQVNLTKLKFRHSRKYFVEVRPVFMPDKFEIRGSSSKTLVFYTMIGSTEPPSQNILAIKIIVYAVTGTAVSIVLSIFIYIKFIKDPAPDVENNTSESDGPLLPRDPVARDNRPTDVLLVHDGHCNRCNEATHALANVLCDTGHINCFLDLCSTNAIAKDGPLRWHEEKFKTCKKVVIICTKESKKTYENDRQDTRLNTSQASYLFVLSMIRGQKVNNNNSTPVIPVYFDHSSPEDIPCLLTDRQIYALPSEIDNLLMCLSGFNARTINVMGQYSLDRTKESKRKIREWKNAILRAEKYHCDTEKVSFVNYMRSLSLSSAEESSSYVSKV